MLAVRQRGRLPRTHSSPTERGLMDLAAGAVEQARNEAFVQRLQQLGWLIGRNIQIEYRWSGGRADDIRKFVAELAALAPDVIHLLLAIEGASTATEAL